MKNINLILIFCFIVMNVSCNNSSNSAKIDSNSTVNVIAPKEEISLPEVEIAGVYSGTDNLGMESTIILKQDGSLITQSSIGDGSPAYGEWAGKANFISLYIRAEMQPRQLLGHAKITAEGLRINGGNFYTRQ